MQSCLFLKIQSSHFLTCFPTWYICVHSQRIADEGHAGAGGGINYGIHAWRWQRTLFFCSGFRKLVLVGVCLPDLLPVWNRAAKVSNKRRTHFWDGCPSTLLASSNLTTEHENVNPWPPVQSQDADPKRMTQRRTYVVIQKITQHPFLFSSFWLTTSTKPSLSGKSAEW